MYIRDFAVILLGSALVTLFEIVVLGQEKNKKEKSSFIRPELTFYEFRSELMKFFLVMSLISGVLCSPHIVGYIRISQTLTQTKDYWDAGMEIPWLNLIAIATLITLNSLLGLLVAPVLFRLRTECPPGLTEKQLKHRFRRFQFVVGTIYTSGVLIALELIFHQPSTGLWKTIVAMSIGITAGLSVIPDARQVPQPPTGSDFVNERSQE